MIRDGKENLTPFSKPAVSEVQNIGILQPVLFQQFLHFDYELENE